MKDTLVSAIEQHESLAESYGSLSEDRAKALDYYLGNPLGNEVDGRSQVVSRDVWDTVEWIKPQLADIFCGGDEIVNFSPTGPEDVQAAEQETEFVNWVITQKNPWFEIWNGWSHDALLQKVGYVKAYWNDSTDRTKETYDLSFEELPALLMDQEVEIVEQEPTESGYKVTVQRTKQYGCAKMVNLAPENVLVDHNAVGLCLQDPRVAFVEHWEYKTITQLRDDGFDVEDDISDGGENSSEYESDLRDDYQPFKDREGDESDPSMRRVKVRECWIRYDRNDDGLSELLHVVIVGTTILLEEEADMVQIVAQCPTPLPHQHYGLSVADAVKDLQLIKTALLRGSLDNLYLANNGRHVVDEDAINLDDMLVSRPGGVVRKKAGVPMSDAIMPLTHSTTGDIAVPMMEYIDRIGQKRTGVNEQSQGLDPNSLQNKTLGAAQMYMSAAQQRIKFIARVFAETGVKSLFQLVHALTLKHSRKAEIVRLRNRWVQVDPRQWQKRADMQIAVGLGAGDKPQQIAFLTQVLQIQQLAIQAGLTAPHLIYNTLKRLTQAAGFKDPNEFWLDPSTQPPMPPQPDPEVLKEQAKIQGQMQIEAGKAQTQVMLAREQNALKMRELEANLALQASNDSRDAEREMRRAEFEAQLANQKLLLEQWKTQFTEEMGRLLNQTDNATRLQIAEMQAGAQMQAKEADIIQQDKQFAREDMREGVQEKSDRADKAMQGMDSLAQTLKDIAAAQAQIIKAQGDLQQTLSRPKKVIRGADGKVSGVELA